MVTIEIIRKKKTREFNTIIKRIQYRFYGWSLEWNSEKLPKRERERKNRRACELLTSKNLMPRRTMYWCGNTCGCRGFDSESVLPWVQKQNLKAKSSPSIPPFGRGRVTFSCSSTSHHTALQLFLFVTLSVLGRKVSLLSLSHHTTLHTSLSLCLSLTTLLMLPSVAHPDLSASCIFSFFSFFPDVLGFWHVGHLITAMSLMDSGIQVFGNVGFAQLKPRMVGVNADRRSCVWPIHAGQIQVLSHTWSVQKRRYTKST